MVSSLVLFAYITACTTASIGGRIVERKATTSFKKAGGLIFKGGPIFGTIQTPVVKLERYTDAMTISSLVTSPCAPPGEKRSGERSRIS